MIRKMLTNYRRKLFATIAINKLIRKGTIDPSCKDVAIKQFLLDQERYTRSVIHTTVLYAAKEALYKKILLPFAHS